MRRLAAIFTLVFAATAPAARPIQIQATGFPGYCGDSLECLMDRCDTVVRATIASVNESSFEANITETFKGQIAAGKTITVHNSYPLKKGQDIILTLREERNGQQVLGTYSLWWPIMLNGERPYYEMDIRPLFAPAEILASVRKIAAHPSDKKLETVGLMSGGRILHVPADLRLEKLAQGWAAEKTVYRRILALQALRPFKSPQNIEIAQALLSDTRSEQVRRIGKWQEGPYDVRENAVNLFKNWGIKVPKLPDGGPILTYRPVPRPPIAWIICTLATVFILAGTSICWPIARRVTLNLILLALVLGLAFLWLRSRTRIDEIMFAAGLSHHEFTSYSGGIQYEVLRDWNHQGGGVYGTFERGFNDDVWSIESQNPTSRKDLIGFVRASGLAAGPGGSSHRFGLLRIPYWALMVPPSALLLLGALKLRQQIRRVRLGLCRKCGYDLRESRGGICPECGNPIARPNPSRGSEPCLAFSSSTPAA